MSSPSSTLGMSSSASNVAEARHLVPDEFAWITYGIQLFVIVGYAKTHHLATVQSAPHYVESTSSWTVDIQWVTAMYRQTVPCQDCTKLTQANHQRTRNRPNKFQMPGGSTWENDQAATPKQEVKQGSVAGAIKHRKKKVSSCADSGTRFKEDTASVKRNSKKNIGTSRYRLQQIRANARKHGKNKSSSRAAGTGVRKERASVKRNSHININAQTRHLKNKPFARITEQPPIAVDLTISSDDENVVQKGKSQQSSISSHTIDVSSDLESSIASNIEEEDSLAAAILPTNIPERKQSYYYDCTIEVSSNSSISESSDSCFSEARRIPDEFAWITDGIQLFVLVGKTHHLATVESTPHYVESTSSWAVAIQWVTAMTRQAVSCKDCSKLPQANHQRTRNRPNKLQMPGGSTWKGDQVAAPKQEVGRGSVAGATKHGTNTSSSCAAGTRVKKDTSSVKKNSKKNIRSISDNSDENAIRTEQSQQSLMSHIADVSSDSDSSIASNSQKEDSPVAGGLLNNRLERKKYHYDYTMDVSSNSSISESSDSFIDDSSQREAEPCGKKDGPKRYFGDDFDVSSNSSSESSSSSDNDNDNTPVDEVDGDATESEESVEMRHETTDQSMSTDSPCESSLSVRRGDRTKERGTLKQDCTAQQGNRDVEEFQRQILEFFTYMSGDRQTDPLGGGFIASKHIPQGTKFIDVSSEYVVGKFHPSLLPERRDIIQSGNGYFNIKIGMTQWINEARDDTEPNILFKNDCDHNKIAWQVIRDIQVDEEMLAVYDQNMKRTSSTPARKRGKNKSYSRAAGTGVEEDTSSAKRNRHYAKRNHLKKKPFARITEQPVHGETIDLTVSSDDDNDENDDRKEQAHHIMDVSCDSESSIVSNKQEEAFPAAAILPTNRLEQNTSNYDHTIGERTKERDTLKRVCALKQGDRFVEFQREMLEAVRYVSDERQSDPFGGGFIARRPIPKGTEFIDVSSKYVPGKAPHSLLTERGDTIKSGDGYFNIRIGMTQWINEARDDKKANIRFKKNYKYGDYGDHKIAWYVIRDIQVDEEILAVYDQDKL